MQTSKTISLLMLPWLIRSTSTGSPFPTVPSGASLVNLTPKLSLPATVNISGSAARQVHIQKEPASIGPSHVSNLHSLSSLNDYPIDPYQLRVPDTTTSLIFSKYGRTIDFQTFLDLTAKAQYQTVKAVIAARGDGPVSRSRFAWSEKMLHIRISRPPAQQDLTWLMLADTLEGVRIFFDGLQGWFETTITILDDTAGPVGDGSIDFGYGS